MSARNEHPIDALHDLVSGELDPQRRSEVERHLAECASCAAERRGLQTLRGALAGLSSDAAPESLRLRIATVLDAEEARSRERAAAMPGWLPRALVYGAGLVILVLLVVFSRSRADDLPRTIAGDFGDFRSELLQLEMVTTDRPTLEGFFAHRGVEFETRVLDLGMMGYELVGGRVHELAGRRSALFVYRDAGGRYVICQMFLGKTAELPAGAEIREHHCIDFHVYRRRGLTLSFWQEGPVVCVLTSDIDPEEVVQLAFAKAQRVM